MSKPEALSDKTVALYTQKSSPSIVNVPLMKFVYIDGQGDPNGEEFALATAALYGFSYTVKMSYRSADVPPGYYEYKVWPLEGVWDIADKNAGISDKRNFIYRIMIRQPEFLTDKLFDRFLAELVRKKPSLMNERLSYTEYVEGLCCQMLHIGSYDSEPASFELMEKHCVANGYTRAAKVHREIYLSDPRRTEPAKLRTILRYNVLICGRD